MGRAGRTGFGGPLTVRAYRHVIPNGTYHFLRAIEGDQLVVEYATVCFRSQEDFGPFGSACAQSQYPKRVSGGVEHIFGILFGTSARTWKSKGLSRGLMVGS